MATTTKRRPSKGKAKKPAKVARRGAPRPRKAAKRAAPREAYIWNRAVAARTLDETAFILLKSRMVRLNPTGTRIWELFEKGAPLDHVVDRIVAEFETTRARALSDARGFVAELCERELLVPLTRETGRPL